MCRTGALNTTTILLVYSVLSRRRLNRCVGVYSDLNVDTLIRVRSRGRTKVTMETNTEVVNIGGHGLGSFAISATGDGGLHSLVPSSVVFMSRDNMGDASSVETVHRVKTSTILVKRALVETSSGGTGLSRLQLDW